MDVTESPTESLPDSLPDSLPLTGERTVPGIPHENYWFLTTEPLYDLRF